MLKTRLIPCIITKGELVVQSFGFKKYLPIGNVKTAIEFFVNWDVDEIIVNDIDATKDGRVPNFELVSWAAKECFVPLTVGGGIKSVDHIRQLLKAGADKVAINSLALENPDFITESSSLFGSQCITVSIDAIKHADGYRVFDYQKQSSLDLDVVEWAIKVESLGAGEILLNSVDRDGSREGYDTKLLRCVSERLSIPVIALGGIGRFDQLAAGATVGGCQALAAANIFQHMEHSTIAAKAQMRNSGLNVRLSSEVKYEDFSLDILGRPF
ncbi:HisA/HisF-related TIM barrel protein [Vibrio cholerae]|uniref:HisA/HisF-related TIM barrel protein n=1 Tax=Vibrio cholerae TaxID=666 RepID=UPI000BA91A31|nr:HisA/HisF-related TIM barrel protein [Vibrio cholerae]EGR1307538.1 imidazole glycerol phosphate synthase subunit HisF [Vibrio cholerae]EIA3113427.1 imidazole glycerol phosphate synthase subunit HisF [Vibrio cholerae]EJL6549153.1 imidazole glycerol phosphate synthase subunit HisF [Vibrio cholerae]EKF9595359.1 imidazole glycerol phosphate synthase subunit HisF [Vibrio cholerae]ELB8603071.1 imidazole glycerol phosphate synthase subunit HisF [Vibrio cholerae]